MRNCIKCQHPISAERLDVLPETTICAPCVKQQEYRKPTVRTEILDPQPYIDVKIPYVRMFDRKSTVILNTPSPTRSNRTKKKTPPQEPSVEVQFYIDGQFHHSFRYRTSTICYRYPITSDQLSEYMDIGYIFCVRNGVLWAEHTKHDPIQIGRPHREMVVYKITNTLNGKIYVGQDTKNNPKYLGSGNLIKAAIRQYGKEHFIKEIVEICDPNYMLSERDRQRLLDEREEYWIKHLRARNPAIGYNLANVFKPSTQWDLWNNRAQARRDAVPSSKKITRRVPTTETTHVEMSTTETIHAVVECDTAAPIYAFETTYHSYDVTDLDE